MPAIPLRAERPATFGPTREWAITYTLTIVGLLRIIEMALVLIAFLCSVCPVARYIGDGWVNFVTITAFISVVICFLVHVLNVIPQNIINQYIEVISYAVFTVFLLIAAIIVAAGAGGNSSLGASAFFCFASMFLWLADTVLQFLQLRGTWSASPPAAAAAGTTSQPPAYTVEGSSTPSQGDSYPSAVHY